jgi:hypothetical protein
MTYYIIKLVVSAGIIVAVSEIAKTNAAIGAFVNSLPIVSVTAATYLVAVRCSPVLGS